jgi:hypothetical protein
VNFDCRDCTNRASVCPSCWEDPVIETTGRCSCRPPLHMTGCHCSTRVGGRRDGYVYFDPACPWAQWRASLAAFGGIFRKPVREDLRQSWRRVMTHPEGEYFTLGIGGMLCGCGRAGGHALTWGSIAVRRGTLLYQLECDPAPACHVCGVRLAEPVIRCWGCQPLWRAMLAIGDGLADYFNPRPSGKEIFARIKRINESTDPVGFRGRADYRDPIDKHTDALRALARLGQ